MAFGFFNRVQEYYSELWKAIVRPPRDDYTISDLGSRKFRLNDGRIYARTDFEITTQAGEKIVASHHEPSPEHRPLDSMPCVIYLHGNCSSRIEAISTVPFLLPLNITVCGFDFTGSGLSDGEYVTLGWKEQHDLRAVMDHLREFRRVSHIALWGRSMGAVTALLQGNQASVLGMVCDSPFSNLRKLAEEIAQDFLPLKVPKIIVTTALNLIRSTVKDKIEGFDIDKLDLIGVVQESSVPALFITGMDDNFVKKHHAEALFEAYHGDKWLLEVNGDHNSQRSTEVMKSAAVFLYKVLGCADIFEAHKLRSSYLRAWKQLQGDVKRETLWSSIDMSEERGKVITEKDGSVENQGEDQSDDLSKHPKNIAGMVVSKAAINRGPIDSITGSIPTVVAASDTSKRIDIPANGAITFSGARSARERLWSCRSFPTGSTSTAATEATRVKSTSSDDQGPVLSATVTSEDLLGSQHGSSPSNWLPSARDSEKKTSKELKKRSSEPVMIETNDPVALHRSHTLELETRQDTIPGQGKFSSCNSREGD